MNRNPLPIVLPSNASAQFTDEPEAFQPRFAAEGPLRLGPLELRLARVVHGECWATRIGDALCYTADSEPWYVEREPIQVGPDLYYPAGAALIEEAVKRLGFTSARAVTAGSVRSLSQYQSSTRTSPWATRR